MKIIIDARFWGPSHTGLGVYTKNLVENLAKLDRANKYLVFVPEINAITENFPGNFSFKQISARPYSLKEQIVVCYQLYKEAPDLVHFPSINVPIFYFGKYVVTIHDLIKHYSRGADTTTQSPIFYWLKYLVYLFVFNWSVLLSKKIIVPSNAVKDELVISNPQSASKTLVTYEGVSLDRQKADPSILKDLPENYCLYVGNAYPHKNLEILISSWSKIFSQTKTKLVIVCGRSVFSSRLEKMISQNHASQFVKVHDYLHNEQVAAAMKKARVYVFPTLMEGFGLPGIDAMSLGTPVICSDIPVLREIYGTAALYFDPKDAQDIQEKIISVLENNKLCQKLIQSGKKQAQKYSWQKMAKETLEIYELALK